MQNIVRNINPEKLEQIAEVLKTVAHPLRLSVVDMLDRHEKLSVNELVQKLGVEQSLLSHHLSKMKDKGVLTARREGKKIYYRLTDPHITSIFDCMMKCDFIR